ncbi:MAG TPA: DUF1192 domain-containing protein [Mesorhizobium sp.]|jgi:uncharacterized small protein (DUF1192 family)|nr:DUF1192 domain-containing protein [Mesorhizobium sp.]
MAFIDDDRPKPKRRHEIGEDVSLLGAGELQARVGELKDEIARLQAELAARDQTRSAAESLFKR